MKLFFSLILFLFLPLAPLRAQPQLPEDQLLVVFGSSGYILFKVLDFANDHGYRYVKILNYEFSSFDHTMTGSSHAHPKEGRFFELKDDHSSISFLCFEKKPEDPYIIDLENYRHLLAQIDLD